MFCDKDTHQIAQREEPIMHIYFIIETNREGSYSNIRYISTQLASAYFWCGAWTQDDNTNSANRLVICRVKDGSDMLDKEEIATCETLGGLQFKSNPEGFGK